MPSPITNSWTLDHLGHAVRDLDQSLKMYRELFGFELEHREYVEQYQVDVAFISLANTRLELIQPHQGNQTLNKFLEKRGEGLHHICFRVPSVSEELKRLKEQKVRLIDEVPRLGAHAMSVAFIHPADTAGALIELCCPQEGSEI